MWENDEDKKEDQRHQEAAAFESCCRRILDSPDNEVFKQVLLKIAVGASYSPGVSFDKAAWNEGRRAVATLILFRGGVL